jgi:hypothetical protein
LIQIIEVFAVCIPIAFSKSGSLHNGDSTSAPSFDDRVYILRGHVLRCSGAVSSCPVAYTAACPGCDPEAIGADADKVELNTTPSVFRVVLVNGKMTDASPAGRENEASAISSIVSRAIATILGFKRVAAIRVEYVIRSSEKGNPKIVDMIEFRKGTSGQFRHHVT